MSLPNLSPEPEQVRSSAELVPMPPPAPDLLPPPSFYYPLWRSLLTNFRARFIPENLPPLRITSRPVDVGMLTGDRLSLPWFRTIFTNLGDVITPETLPPLELESRPLDVGELISDQMGHLWWTSLIRSLADRIAPERLPALELTSTPVSVGQPSDVMVLPRWSSLISGPRLPLGEKPKPTYLPPPVAPPQVVPELTTTGEEVDPVHVHATRLKVRLSRSRIREMALISVAVIEAVYLVVSYLGIV
jgi:hypothetical protein